MNTTALHHTPTLTDPRLPAAARSPKASSHWSAKPKAEMWLALVDSLCKLARHHDLEVGCWAVGCVLSADCALCVAHM